MAEFQEVMRQLNRMCSHYQNCRDSGCPLFDECGNIGSYSSNAKQVMRIEKCVMSWAAEHPVIYPTWGMWLAEKYDFDLREIMYTPIPADIAQKLGIEPKGDV